VVGDVARAGRGGDLADDHVQHPGGRNPKISARKVAIRHQKPRMATAATIVKIITVATPGPCSQYTPATTWARLKPISMTTAPLATWGNTVRTARPPTK
jgi:hypothetical protein